ncbi:hypothetical protein ACFYMO_00735 [Streptomyces sp. NPDC007025]|uniref:hypothetical protein n=1 Tax=Streptomyces sp. NPDC007025 TaxID=3364771 RepID=UPI00367E8F8D
MIRTISESHLPALGDIRALGLGDVVYVDAGVHHNDYWGRYVEALAAAISKGASVTTVDVSTMPVVNR